MMTNLSGTLTPHTDTNANVPDIGPTDTNSGPMNLLNPNGTSNLLDTSKPLQSVNPAPPAKN